MNLLLQIQEIVGAPIKDLLLQIQGGLPSVTLPPVNITTPENVTFGDANLGSTFGDANLGSSNFGNGLGSSNFGNQLGSSNFGNGDLGSSNFFNGLNAADQ